MNDSEWHYVSSPSVDVAADGRVAVVWVDQRHRDVFFRFYSEDGRPLTEPVNVSETPEVFSWLPAVATSADGSEVTILWQEIVFSGGSHGGEAFAARSTDGGRSFGEPQNLSKSPAGDGKGRLTADRWDNGSLDLIRTEDGTHYAAWTEYEGKLWVSRSTGVDDPFDEPTRVAGNDQTPARSPRMAHGPDGSLHLVWTVGESNNANVRWAVSSDGGETFSKPVVVADTAGHSDAPSIAVGDDGRAHIVFAEGSGGMFGRYQVVYSVSRGAAEDPDTEFSSPRVISGDSAASFPSIVRSSGVRGETASDEFHVVWERYPDGAKPRDRPRGLGYVSGDGREFSDPLVIDGEGETELGFNGTLQGLLGQKVAVGPGGRVAIVNSRLKPGRSSRVRLYLSGP